MTPRRFSGASLKGGLTGSRLLFWVRRTASLNCRGGYERPCHNTQTANRHRHAFPARAVRRCPSGGPEMTLLPLRQEHRTRVGRRADGHKNAEPVWARLRRVLSLADDYAAVFLTVLDCGLAGGFGSGFASFLALSFAANSCFTFWATASVSIP